MKTPTGQTARQADHTDFAALARHLSLHLEKPLGPRTWLGQTPTGGLAVIKAGPGASEYLQHLLSQIKTLYPPFDFPRIRAAEPGFYLVYDFIPGQSLGDLDFESEAALSAAFDLSGRITALFRSLKLVPMFQGLQDHASQGGTLGLAARRLQALSANLDCQTDGLAVRRWEACQSYAWAQEIVASCAARWPAADSSQTPPWAALQDQLETVTSIHLTAHGSNLAHTRLTPEHLLRTEAGGWGVVGWQVAPRPYNYMRYRYLAWCLVHSSQGEIEPRCRRWLGLVPTIHAAAAHSLTFALSLLEAWVESDGNLAHRGEKLRAVLTFVNEALAQTGIESPGAPALEARPAGDPDR